MRFILHKEAEIEGGWEKRPNALHFSNIWLVKTVDGVDDETSIRSAETAGGYEFTDATESVRKNKNRPEKIAEGPGWAIDLNADTVYCDRRPQ